MYRYQNIQILDLKQYFLTELCSIYAALILFFSILPNKLFWFDLSILTFTNLPERSSVVGENYPATEHLCYDSGHDIDVAGLIP